MAIAATALPQSILRDAWSWQLDLKARNLSPNTVSGYLLSIWTFDEWHVSGPEKRVGESRYTSGRCRASSCDKGPAVSRPRAIQKHHKPGRTNES